MDKLRDALSKVPKGLFSLLTIAAILWLTLAPKPLGENPPPLFPGADKIAHGLMFGGLTAMMLLDWQRIHQWDRVTIGMSTLYATAVAIFGVFIECVQNMMGMGRGFEWWDIVADTVGAFVVALVWIPLQKIWLQNYGS